MNVIIQLHAFLAGPYRIGAIDFDSLISQTVYLGAFPELLLLLELCCGSSIVPVSCSIKPIAEALPVYIGCTAGNGIQKTWCL